MGAGTVVVVLCALAAVVTLDATSAVVYLPFVALAGVAIALEVYRRQLQTQADARRITRQQQAMLVEARRRPGSRSVRGPSAVRPPGVPRSPVARPGPRLAGGRRPSRGPW